MILRDYQKAASDAVFHTWRTDYATLLVMFTGGGKTCIFADVIRRIHPQKVLVLVHREELIWQAHDKIKEHTGLPITIEMGESKPTEAEIDQCAVILSTVQTQYAGKDATRMSRFNPLEFGAVIVDEAHRYVAPRWSDVIFYWKKNPDLRVLGVTATPDRLDRKSLAQIIPHCCFKMGIEDGQAQAWLVPVLAKSARVKELDFSTIHVRKGDFAEEELARIMEEEKVLQGVASVTMQEIGERKAILFAVRVAQAEKLAEIFNRHKADCAFVVSGETRKDTRRELLKDFKAGKYQIMCNVGIATEGFDDPTVKAIVNARPTLSRALYEQMNGRGFRPWPGTVDGPDKDTPEKRMAAIEASQKPNVLVLDLAGNTSKHKLCTVADVLAGDRNRKALERVLKRIEQSDKPVNVRAVLAEAEDEVAREEIAAQRRLEERQKREEEKRRQGIKAKATYTVRYVNPFEAQQFQSYSTGLGGKKGLTQNQWLFLKHRGIEPSANPIWKNYKLISELHAKEANGPPTAPQKRLAIWLGIELNGHTKATLSKAIDRVKNAKHS